MIADKCPLCGEVAVDVFDSGAEYKCGHVEWKFYDTPKHQFCKNAERLAIERAAALSAFKDKVRELMVEMQVGRPWAYKDDAPGHAHTVPGRWDDTGAECRRCTLWREIKEAL